jgi:CRP/FNR family transcriptional regulator
MLQNIAGAILFFRCNAVILRMQERPCDLSSCFLCNNTIPEWKEAIAVRKKTLFFKKGKKIFSEGDPVTGIFFMNEGFAKVYMQWGKVKELIVHFSGRGDVLGFRGMGSLTYPISATAMQDVKVCYIPNDFLEATLKTNPSFTYKLMQVFASELHQTEKRMRDLVHLDVKSRIALALLQIAEIFGTDAKKYISVPIMRQDIASYAGTTYETVFKLMKELMRKKIISTAGKSIKINDRNALNRIIAYHS